MQEFVPLFGPKEQNLIIKDLFDGNVELQIGLLDKAPEGHAPEFSLAGEDLCPLSDIETASWEVSEPIEMKKEDKVFCGTIFYNKKTIVFKWLKPDTPVSLHGFAIYKKGEKLPVIYGKFGTPVIAEPPIKSNIVIPENIIIGHFGRGTFVPTLKEVKDHLEDQPETGCPLLDPNKCKYKDDEKWCAFVKEDKICKKTVRMKSKIDVSNAFGG